MFDLEIEEIVRLDCKVYSPDTLISHSSCLPRAHELDPGQGTLSQGSSDPRAPLCQHTASYLHHPLSKHPWECFHLPRLPIWCKLKHINKVFRISIKSNDQFLHSETSIMHSLFVKSKSFLLLLFIKWKFQMLLLFRTFLFTKLFRTRHNYYRLWNLNC